MPRENLDLLKGTFGLLLLKAVRVQPRHGHDIMKWLKTVTEGAFLVEEGAMYPALHRLERQKLVKGEWGKTENNRRARYYELTAQGRKELAVEEDRWHRYVDTVGKVLAASPA
jgi:PadR family transcriptional regulator PadR